MRGGLVDRLRAAYNQGAHAVTKEAADVLASVHVELHRLREALAESERVTRETRDHHSAAVAVANGATAHLDAVRRELAMVRADRDHLMACQVRERAGRVECDGEGHSPRNMVHLAMFDAMKDEAERRLASEKADHTQAVLALAREAKRADDAERMLAEARAALTMTQADRAEQQRVAMESEKEANAWRKELAEKQNETRLLLVDRNDWSRAARLAMTERDEAKAKLALAEKRADEMEGKAGEWIALDVHRDRVAKAVAEWRESANKYRMERDLARADAEAVKDDRKAVHVRVLRALGCADAQIASVNTEGRCDACGVLPGSMHAADCHRRPGSLVVRKAGEQ